VAAGAGETISVSVTTRNAGGGSAAPSTTHVYFSLDWQLGGGDVLLATRPTSELAPGATDTAAISVTLPADAPGGARYLIAVADGANAVVETQEVNNSTYRSVLVGADLGIASFTVPATGGAGLELTLTDSTRNSGGGTSPASSTSYWLSSDGTLGAGDVLLGSRTVPPLAPGAIDTGSLTLTIPAGTATGNWNVFAVADSGSVVPETYENNNSTSRAVAIGPDLQVPNLAGGPNATAGASYAINETTRNAGGGTAAASTTRYYLSLDGLPNAGDILLGSRALGPLPPDASSTADVTLTIPAGTATGWWYVIAVADGDGAVAETLETNNFRNKSVYVSP
jgi:subtilase family serine protease